MAYEYESDIKSLIIDNPADIDGYYAYEELEEVYQKAKAWEELKDRLTEDYIGQIRHINQYNITDADDTWSSGWNMSTAQQLYTDLCLMDKLDGTNYFSNLLSDLGDE